MLDVATFAVASHVNVACSISLIEKVTSAWRLWIEPLVMLHRPVVVVVHDPLARSPRLQVPVTVTADERLSRAVPIHTTINVLP